MEEVDKKRINRIFIILLLFFIIIGIKAFKIQVFDRDHLIAKSKKQFLRQRKTYPKRGNIYDRNGQPLAINVQTFSLFSVPPKNKKWNIESTIKNLSKIIPELNSSKLIKLLKKRKKFTWLGRKMSLSKIQVSKIKKLKGVYLEVVPKRLYPNHELLSQTLGFVGLDNNGLAGVEYSLDEKLRGKPTIRKYIIDNKGRPISYKGQIDEAESQDVFLSIDKDLQSISEIALKEAVIKYSALRGGVGVMDAKTGEILAMANYPTYDPNDLSTSKARTRKLSFVSDPFEPGSTFKTLTAAAAIEHKMARIDTNYYCERGRFNVEGHIISEAESRKKYEWLSLKEIIKYSSNIGTTKIAFDLTFPKLKETLDLFGIGVKTKLELPGESRGIMTNDKNIKPLRLSNISFGQGVATTGIQMLAAYAAIANDGVFNRPTILKGGNEKKPGRRIISKATARDLTEILTEAVETGTGKNARIPYFKIAGKTSTAQRVDRAGGYNGYVPGFIGYPVNIDNRFVIYVYVDKPDTKNGYYGNLIAAPVFKKIAQHILYKIKAFDQLAVKKNDSKEKGVFDTVIMKQSSTRFNGHGSVPNFVGLDKISARNLSKKYKIKIKQFGIGVISSQNPPSGVTLEKNQVVKLYFSPPSYE